MTVNASPPSKHSKAFEKPTTGWKSFFVLLLLKHLHDLTVQYKDGGDVRQQMR